MTRFFINCRWTLHLRVDEIASIAVSTAKAGSRGEGLHRIVMKDGEENFVDPHQLENITNPMMTVVPAEPGHNVIWDSTEYNDASFSRVPVLAWCIRADASVSPLTIEGEWDGGTPEMPVERPSGEVVFQAATYPSVEAMIAERLKRFSEQPAPLSPPSAKIEEQQS